MVVAAGSIHTPAVLLRSQFEHDLIGKYLTLHPVLGAGSHIPKVNVHVNFTSNFQLNELFSRLRDYQKVYQWE